MDDLQKDINELVGNGQKLRFVTGVDNEKKEIIEEFHFTPVSLKDLPELMEHLNKFLETTQKSSWSKESMDSCGEILVLSLKRMHPDFTKEEALEKFGLGGLAKAVKTAMDINNFLAEMGEINQSLSMGQNMQTKMENLSQQKA